MDSKHRIEVPLRAGGKKMRKRRELDALIAHSITKRNAVARRGVHSQDKLLSGSTDDPEDYAWASVSSSGRRGHRKYMYFRMCGPLFFVIAIAFIIGIMYWLYFDLRQQIYDYRQKIEEVSAISKNLPDTLQKWHETSSYLTRNQSTILIKINDMQKTIDSLRTNLSNLETSVSAQQNYAKDEKLVADFGAKIEAVATDVEIIKDHYNSYISVQEKMQAEMDNLKLNLTANAQMQVKSVPTNYTEELNAAKTTFMDNVKAIETDISLMNDTLSQKTNMLHETLMTHKTRLDDLMDRSENITTHVTTISHSWTEYKQKVVNLENSFNKFENELGATKSMCKNLETSIENLAAICKNQSATTADTMQIDKLTLNGLQTPPDLFNLSTVDKNPDNVSSRTTTMP